MIANAQLFSSPSQKVKVSAAERLLLDYQQTRNSNDDIDGFIQIQ